MAADEKDVAPLPSLSRVLGYIAVKNQGSPETKVCILTRLGYGDAEIEVICGLTKKQVKKARA